MKHQKKQKQEEQLFNVEKIVGKRYDHETNELQYCVKWEGYPDEENTWEPVDNLQNVISFIQEYEANHINQTKKPKTLIDNQKLKQLLLNRLNQFLEQMAPKYELQEISLSDFDSSEEIKVQQQQQETQPKTIPEPYQPKSHILMQGFHWCPQNYESIVSSFIIIYFKNFTKCIYFYNHYYTFIFIQYSTQQQQYFLFSLLYYNIDY